MTDNFWWTVLGLAFFFEAIALLFMVIWWFELRSQAAMLKHSLAECPVCQIATSDVMDFNDETIQHYCSYHLAQWMRIREKERRIKSYNEPEHRVVKHYSELLDYEE